MYMLIDILMLMTKGLNVSNVIPSLLTRLAIDRAKVFHRIRVNIASRYSNHVKDCINIIKVSVKTKVKVFEVCVCACHANSLRNGPHNLLLR